MKTGLLLPLLLGALLTGCTDRQHRNPLDPRHDGTATALAAPLQALAGDREVRLSWDYGNFEDVAGYYLYRRAAGGDFVRHPAAPLAADAREYADREVENGTTYEYRLGLLIEGEEERLLAQLARATPGRALAWVADRTNGMVWKISADGGNAWFGLGRFPSIVGMDLDRADRSCWVSDQFFSGVYHLTPDGDLELRRADVEEAGPIRIDTEGRRGWLVDRKRREVKWFALNDGADTLALHGVDARFATPIALAPWQGGCWIADQEEDRVLFYAPGEGRVEFEGVEQPIAIAAVDRERAWILIRQGRALARLSRDGGRLVVELPFGDGVDLDLDRRAGRVWVLGETGAAVFDPEGNLLRHLAGLSEGRSLAVDEVHGQVWIATRTWLLKFSEAGEEQARLGGFYGSLRVAVDPGE
jgi:hypothetical protein